jgi:hypothetical protein
MQTVLISCFSLVMEDHQMVMESLVEMLLPTKKFLILWEKSVLNLGIALPLEPLDSQKMMEICSI